MDEETDIFINEEEDEKNKRLEEKISDLTAKLDASNEGSKRHADFEKRLNIAEGKLKALSEPGGEKEYPCPICGTPMDEVKENIFECDKCCERFQKEEGD